MDKATSTLATGGGTVPLDPVGSRVYTREQLALALGESESWVRDQDRAGVISPTHTKGRLQYNLAALMKLSALKILKRQLGSASPVPGRIVKQASEKIESLCARPDLYPVDCAAALSAAIEETIWSPEVRASLLEPLSAARSSVRLARL